MYFLHEWESDFKFDDQMMKMEKDLLSSLVQIPNSGMQMTLVTTRALSSRATRLSCLIVKLIQQEPLDDGFNGSKLQPTEIFGSGREVQINS